MKKLIVFFMLIGATSFAGEFKVISYNIWNGFDHGKGITQCENFVTWMTKEDPDVVAYQELCGFNSIKLKKLARDFGHKYSVIQKIGGYPVGISSKYPIADVKKLRSGFWHGALSCKINGINFLVVHLSPSCADFRLKESNMILDFLEKSGKLDHKTIILGDFNASSEIDREFLEDQEIYEDDNVNDFTVMKNFLDNRLSDSRALLENNLGGLYSFPGNLLVKEEESHGSQVRIDYQLVTKPLIDLVISSQIVQNKLTKEISDHYPVKVLYNL